MSAIPPEPRAQAPGPPATEDAKEEATETGAASGADPKPAAGQKINGAAIAGQTPFPTARPDRVNPSPTPPKERPESIFPLAERVPIQLFDRESLGKKLSYWGPLVTGVASIVLTVFVWVSTRRISEQQIAIQTRQTQLQEEQVRAELADMRTKFFNDLTSTDETKKTFAAISLAGHGLKAWPVIHLALGVEQGDIRRSAVSVVYRMFQAEINSKDRTQVLDQLKLEFECPNETLHLGVIESLVELDPLMNPDEREQMRVFVQAKVPPETACKNPTGQGIVHEAAKFLNATESAALPFFLSVASVPECGDGWQQAMVKLENAAPDLSPPQRRELLAKIQRIRTNVLNNLGTNGESNTPRELGSLGTKNGSSNLGGSKQTIEQEFNRLERALSDK